MAAMWLGAACALSGCAGGEADVSTSDQVTAETTESAGSAGSTESTENTGATEGTDSAADSGQTDAVSSDPVSAEFFAMDTIMQVQAYGVNAEKAIEEAQAEVERLDALLSTGKETSEISTLNLTGSGILSEDGIYLMQRSLELYEDTEGAFDITIYPIMKLWGFAVSDVTEVTADTAQEAEAATADQHVPGGEEIAKELELVDASKIVFDAETGEVSFEEAGMSIDFGGIAKGYTSSRLMEIFAENGIESGLVTLGGNVQVLGTKPDGSAWKVGIQDPDNTDGVLCGIAVVDKAVITSGGYQRFFTEDGVSYHHIIDPSTGYPADSGLKSVTIVSGDGTLADGLATAVFIMGREKATAYWRDHREEFDMILVEEDGTVSVTEGIVPDVLGDISFEKIS